MIVGSEGLVNVGYEEVRQTAIPAVIYDPFVAPERSAWDITDIGHMGPGDMVAIEEPALSRMFGQLGFALPHVVLGVTMSTVDVMRYDGLIRTLDRGFGDRDPGIELDTIGTVIDASERVSLSPLSQTSARGVLRVLGERDLSVGTTIEDPLTLGLRAIANYFALLEDERSIFFDRSYRAAHPNWKQQLQTLGSS
jgi:hypothetical protein